MTPDFLRASLDGDLVRAARLISASVPEAWPDCAAVLKLRLAQLEADPALQPWLLRAMIDRRTSAMVGHIGFHTAPNPDYLAANGPGGIEFGFTVFEPFRRRGHAFEASRALMRWADERHGVRRFVLSIRPNNLPSQTLAAKLGFLRIGSHVDEEDGPEDVLELRLD